MNTSLLVSGVGVLAFAGLASAAVTSVTTVDTTEVAPGDGQPVSYTDYLLRSISVGGNTEYANDSTNARTLFTGTSTGEVHTSSETSNYHPDDNPGGGWRSFASMADDDSLNSYAARNAQVDQAFTTVGFGGADWVNTNGDGLDFYIFEAGAGGNTDGDITVRAVLTDDSLGPQVNLPGGTWGDTGLDISGAPNGGHAVNGIAFAVEDLQVSADTVLKGIQLESAGGDFIYVGAVIIPEPASLALIGLGGLAMLRRRH